MRTSLLLIVLALSACAMGPKMPTSLEDRVQARWDALLAGDYETAYAYLTPGYRQTESLASFQGKLRNRPVRWVAAKFDSIEKCAVASSCDVLIAVTYRVRGLPQVGTHQSTRKLSEKWVQIDGDWYHLPAVMTAPIGKPLEG